MRLICEKDSYGYEISKEIASRTRDEFQIKEATLYAVFQRLKKKGLITSYSGSESLGSTRRYYRITNLGKAYLREEIADWRRTKEIIDIFMEGLL